MPQAYQQGDEPVPGYRLTNFLGRGGFGEVWKATAPGGAEAAMKIIHLGGQEGRKEFRALQLVKRIRHPNLVPIVAFWLKNKDGEILDDAFTGQDMLPASETTPGPLRATMVVAADQGRPQAAELIVAMGLGDLSLLDRLQQCRSQGLDGIPRDELMGYMEDVAAAIDFLNSPIHDLGSGAAAIQHCDIKPHNLLIVGGAVQICDFGLARMLGADRATSAAATIAYAAPECLQTGKPSGTTDQYSLAVSYYELRTGALPYGDESLAAVLDAKQHETLDFSRVAGPEQAVLRHATRCDPAQRFPLAATMVKALREATGTAVGGETGSRASRRAGGPRRILGTLAVFLLAAGAAAGGWFYWTQQGDQRPADNEMGVDRAPPIAEPTPSERGRAWMAKNELDKAVTQFSAALAVRKTVADLVDRGRAYLQLDRRGEAMADFDEALQMDDANAAAHFFRGTCYLSDNDTKMAIADFEKAMALDAGGALGYRSRAEYGKAYMEDGTAALKKQDYEQAIARFDQAARHEPHNARVFVRRAGAWFGKKNYARVVEDLTTSLDIEKNDEDYVNRGRAYRELGDLDKAAADFGEAIRLNPQNPAAFAHRGDVHMTKYDTTAAKRDLDQALADLTGAVDACRKNPGSTFRLENAYLLRASCYMLGKDNDHAAGDFAEVLRIVPGGTKNLHVLLDALANGYAADGKSSKAVEWETKAIELTPDEDTKAEYRTRLQRYRSGKS